MLGYRLGSASRVVAAVASVASSTMATGFPNPGWHGGAIVNPNMHGVLVLRDPLFANNTPLSSRIAPPHGMYRATPTVGR